MRKSVVLPDVSRTLFSALMSVDCGHGCAVAVHLRLRPFSLGRVGRMLMLKLVMVMMRVAVEVVLLMVERTLMLFIEVAVLQHAAGRETLILANAAGWLQLTADSVGLRSAN